jgi:hypothetical protein
MDLFIDKENFKPVFQTLKEHFGWGIDTLFVTNGQLLKKGNLEFGKGWEDTALFIITIPMMQRIIRCYPFGRCMNGWSC